MGFSRFNVCDSGFDVCDFRFDGFAILDLMGFASSLRVVELRFSDDGLMDCIRTLAERDHYCVMGLRF